MECEKERIIQVSISKITDSQSRRRRGGPTLRRNLFVSHILNNVLTKADVAYQEYRTTAEIDMEVESWEPDDMPCEKPKALTECAGGSIVKGNRQESSHSLCSVGESTELPKLCCPKTTPARQEIVTNDICRDAQVSGTNCSINEESSQIHDARVTGIKRPRYGNEPCDCHVVCNKRVRFDSSTETANSACDFHEPMDISGLVSVFSSSFGGLSGLSASSKPSFEPFQCLDSISPIAAFPQTVEAF